MEENKEKEENSLYQKWWFWVIIAIVLLVVVKNVSDNYNANIYTSHNTSNLVNTTNNTYNKVNTTNNIKVEKANITIVDFSQMSKEEIQNWCNENKIKCSITEDYSESIPKGAFVSQSVSANSTIDEGEKVNIIYSLGKKPTIEQQNALKQAQSYSSNMHMSKKRLYKQLTSEYGEGFTAEAAQYAIDNVVADWNENALATAKSYQTTMNMSKSRIYSQLTSAYGEEFTASEAQYAIDHLEN